MFGRNKDKSASGGNAGEFQRNEENAPPLKPFSRKGSHAPARPPVRSTFHPDIPRRYPGAPNAPIRAERTRPTDTEGRKLIVGREICLKGEITACDKLIIEGEVEVALSNARAIDVAPSGFFRGNAEVDEADISGQFEGELIVRDKLTVRSSGKVSGSIRYGRIVIESGGQISGDMKALEPEGPGGKASSSREGQSESSNA
ncbi:MAG: bactofilin family protein [Rhodospirillales bacterium]|jgi:cytoskeletal protein CcmA (bactofilin family)